MAVVSSSMPKNVRQVVGPSSFSGFTVAPTHHRGLASWQVHAGIPWDQQDQPQRNHQIVQNIRYIVVVV